MKYFLLLGMVGVGKSSFINTHHGSEIAETCPYEPCTKVVRHYVKNSTEDFCLIDTPGLCEDEDSEQDKYYLKMIKNAIENISLSHTVYVTPLNISRFSRQEKHTLRLITDHLGPLVWSNSKLLLTFASKVPNERLDDTIEIRKNKIVEELREYTKKFSPKEHFMQFQKIMVTDNKTILWDNDSVGIDTALLD